MAKSKTETEKKLLETCLAHETTIRMLNDDVAILKKENDELRLKCTKLLNENFLLVAQYNNIKSDLEFIMRNFCIEPDEFSYIAYEDKYIFEEFEYVIELTPEEFERYKKISTKN